MNFDYCNGSVYVIKQGDTLYSISRRYNVPLALILRANPYVDIYNLQIGDELCIPENQPIYPDGMPEPGPWPNPCLPCVEYPNGVPVPLPSFPDGNNPNGVPVPLPSFPDGNNPNGVPVPLPSFPDENNPNGMPVPLPSFPDENNPNGMPVPLPSFPDRNNPNGMLGAGQMPLPASNSQGENNQNGMSRARQMPLSTPNLASNNNQQMYHLIAYVVKDKDTLQKLLDYFGITLSDLLRYNNLDEIQLKPGMTIQIPKKSDD